MESRHKAARQQKIREWRTKGYSLALIEIALKWGDEWSRGIIARFIKDPDMRTIVQNTLYLEALELSSRYLEAMSK